MSTNNSILSTLRPAAMLFVGLTVVVGLAYPLAMTGIAKLAFNEKAEGSLIVKDGKVVGSSLIGQSFSSPQFFWGRPSATSPMANNATISSGSNLGSTNVVQLDNAKARIDALKVADPSNTAAIPVDLVTASASGLDPEISLAAAYYQVPRVARERKMTEAQVRALIDQLAQKPVMGLFGEPRVNVLQLNLALPQSK